MHDNSVLPQLTLLWSSRRGLLRRAQYVSTRDPLLSFWRLISTTATERCGSGNGVTVPVVTVDPEMVAMVFHVVRSERDVAKVEDVATLGESSPRMPEVNAPCD